MPVVTVYDLQRGPVAADAIDATLDSEFSAGLADALCVSNVDILPPVALMAEWAVRCAYTDGVDGWAPQVAVDDAARDLVCAALQHPRDDATVDRFLHAVLQFVTHGWRARSGLWPDVHVELSPCRHQSRQMRLALVPTGTDDAVDGLASCRHRGRELLAQAKVVLGAGWPTTSRRSTINCTRWMNAILPTAPFAPCPNLILPENTPT